MTDLSLPKEPSLRKQTDTDKFILDATAGFRMMWFNKHHPNAIYLDQRPECEPDIVGDFRDLKQFPDETFRLIVFDPPHMIRGSASKNNDLIRKFGCLNPDNFKDDFRKGFRELWRKLAPYGILIFKWNNRYFPSNEVLELFPEKPLVYQITSNKNNEKGSQMVSTMWFCFMKIPEKELTV